MLVIQTTIDRKAMTALAKMSRKTLRQGRSRPVRTLAWFVVALEIFLTVVYIRGGESGWPINVLLAAFMLGCLLGEDQVNGAVGLRQVLPNSREVNATFKNDSFYVHRTQAAESWLPYREIKAVCETKEYFALLQSRNHGHIYDKNGFSWGTPEEFRAFIQQKTGLKIQKVQ